MEYEGAFYHVTARGNERRKIYFSEYDYQKFREYFGTSKQQLQVIINRKKEDIVFRELIGGISYAAISKAYQRFDIKLKVDKSLVKVIKKLEDRMSYV